MSSVTDLQAAFSANPEIMLAPHRRLVVLSRALAVLFLILIGAAALWVLGAFLFSFFFADHVLIGADGVVLTFPQLPEAASGYVRFSAQPFFTRAAGFVDVVIAMIPIGFVCWHLRALFRLYSGGVVFARENATHLKRVGLWLTAWPAAKFSANMLFQLAGGTDRAWAQMILLDALILGLIVFAIAQVMEFGHQIEQDRAEII